MLQFALDEYLSGRLNALAVSNGSKHRQALVANSRVLCASVEMATLRRFRRLTWRSRLKDPDGPGSRRNIRFVSHAE